MRKDKQTGMELTVLFAALQMLLEPGNSLSICLLWRLAQNIKRCHKIYTFLFLLQAIDLALRAMYSFS